MIKKQVVKSHKENNDQNHRIEQSIHDDFRTVTRNQVYSHEQVIIRIWVKAIRSSKASGCVMHCLRVKQNKNESFIHMNIKH